MWLFRKKIDFKTIILNYKPHPIQSELLFYHPVIIYHMRVFSMICSSHKNQYWVIVSIFLKFTCSAPIKALVTLLLILHKRTPSPTSGSQVWLTKFHLSRPIIHELKNIWNIYLDMLYYSIQISGDFELDLFERRKYLNFGVVVKKRFPEGEYVKIEKMRIS